MVGDDANIVLVEFLKQLLEIIRNMSMKSDYQRDPKELGDSVKSALKEYRDSIEESEKYLISVTDDTVNMILIPLL